MPYQHAQAHQKEPLSMIFGQDLIQEINQALNQNGFNEDQSIKTTKVWDQI